MKTIVSGLIWATVILAIALASHFGGIAKDSATTVILGLAVISAIQLGVIGQRRRSCGSCRSETR